MSRWQPDHYVMGIALGGIALFQLSAGKSKQLAAIPGRGYLPGPNSAASADWQAIFTTVFAQVGKLAANGQVFVTLADDWVRYWVVTPPAGIQSFAELQDLARSRFDSLYGGNIDEWHLQADWHAEHGILVAAMPNKMLEALKVVCAAQKLALVSAQPTMIKLINRHSGQIGNSAWVCVFGERGINALLCHNGTVRHVRRLGNVRLATVEDLVAELDTELLRTGNEAPEALCLLGRVPFFDCAPRVGAMKVKCLGELKVADQGAKFSEMAYWPAAL